MTPKSIALIVIISAMVSVGRGEDNPCTDPDKVDSRGFPPINCHAVLNSNGDCLFDRVIPREECQSAYEEGEYETLVQFQQRLEDCYQDPSCSDIPRLDRR